MFEYSEILDISVTLGEEAPTYPGDPSYCREKVFSQAKGDTAEVSKLTLCAHSGTHLDLPSHFFPKASGVGELPLERFILPARVVEIADPREVKRGELDKAGLENKRAVLLKTENSRSGLVVSGRFSERYAHIGEKAAEYLATIEVPLVGLDYYSIDPFGTPDYPAHRILLCAGIPVLEGINLDGVPEGDYILICLPLKLGAVEASPVRAVLLR